MKIVKLCEPQPTNRKPLALAEIIVDEATNKMHPSIIATLSASIGQSSKQTLADLKAKKLVLVEEK